MNVGVSHLFHLFSFWCFIFLSTYLNVWISNPLYKSTSNGIHGCFRKMNTGGFSITEVGLTHDINVVIMKRFKLSKSQYCWVLWVCPVIINGFVFVFFQIPGAL